MQGHTQKIDTTLPEKGSSSTSPERIGKYEILGPIGEGGFGMVYKGFDPFIKRHVAIKTCASPDPELRQRYFREAEIAGRLDHPNIVRIFDFGIEDDTPYLVQEFLAGNDLDHKIEGHEFVPFPERLLYLIHIARGLAFAHDQDVIHRDIKPANIRILEDGSAKIMDFGVAMLLNTDTRLTQDGMAVGTAAYLAPEQVKGETPDNRSDIFSYGVLAYELLTGTRPFLQETISATLYAILHDDPKPIQLPAHTCPASLSRLIGRCLEKDADHRPGDMSAILAELDSIRQEMRTAPSRRNFASELRQVAAGDGRATPPRRFDPPIEQEWTPPAVRMRQRRRWIRWVGPTAVLAALATAYGVLASQGIVPWPEASIPSLVLAASTQATGTMGPTPRFQESAVSTFTAAQDLPLAVPSQPPARPAERAAPAEATAAPAVVDATLYFTRGWHPGITATIDGGEPMRLDRPRSRRLAPGEHVVRFRLSTAGYDTAQTVKLQLRPGEERRLDNPITRPGSLSVQASLGSPQGLVRLDGRPLGTSPIRGHSLPPGRHQLQVFSTKDTSLPLAETTVDVRSARETVVTFDLTGQRELAVRYREPSS